MDSVSMNRSANSFAEHSYADQVIHFDSPPSHWDSFIIYDFP